MVAVVAELPKAQVYGQGFVSYNGRRGMVLGITRARYVSVAAHIHCGQRRILYGKPAGKVVRTTTRMPRMAAKDGHEGWT